MDSNEERFAAQIKAIVSAGETNDTLEERPLTLSELKELAISMGLNEEQWQALLVKAQKHLKLADDHLKARNYKDAVLEGEQAVAINPYLTNCNAILAKAYMMMWLEDHNPSTREKAEYYARKELLVDPRDQQAVMVLSTIQKKSGVLEKDNKSRKKFYILLGVVAVVLLIIIFFLVSAANKNNQEAEQNQQTSEYNQIRDQLIEAEEDVASKLDLVQVAIDQRNSMLPDLFSAVQQSPAELTVLDSTIQTLQQQIKNSEGEEKFQLENSLSAKVDEAKNIVSQLGEKSAVEKLLVQIEGSENRIAFEKKNYNEAVKKYNILVKKHHDQFPQYEIKPYYNEQ
ncbi:MAG: LemA family protein [Crocinitomicaceae bacterium]|nr:LemA family protein [Crocinitomicaceae bacterium]MBK8925330.1 LemA family protein [Crocinitomicaceae bacterium]